jgi:flagellar export protein FliJ
MKRFEFRLERILRYRTRVEEEKRATVGRAGEAVGRQEKLFTEANAAEATAREELRKDAGVGLIDVRQATQQRVHVDVLGKSCAEMTRQLAALEREFAARREEAVKAQRDRKTMENLRARRHGAHVRGGERAEQKELDDVSAKNAWARRNEA